MARRHAILAALVVAAALWAYFIVHPLGGGAPGPEHKVTVWQVPLRQVTGLTYREGPLRATLEPRWEPGAAKPYLWIDSEMELHGPPGAKAKGGKTPPDQAKPERDHIAFKGNATAQQVLAQFANLTADRDLGPLSGLEAKDFGLPEQDAFVEVARGDAPALRLELGRSTFGDSGRYVHNTRDDHVYLLRTQDLRRLATLRGSMVDHDLLGTKVEAMEKAELRGPQGTRTFYRLAKPGLWGASASATSSDPNMEAIANALDRIKVLRYTEEEPVPGDSQSAAGASAEIGAPPVRPSGPPALEVRLTPRDSGAPEAWVRFYDGEGHASVAESSYTRHPVQVAGSLVKQVLQQARAALRGT